MYLECIPSVSETAPCRRNMLSFMLTARSPLRKIPTTRSYVRPG